MSTFSIQNLARWQNDDLGDGGNMDSSNKQTRQSKICHISMSFHRQININNLF